MSKYLYIQIANNLRKLILKGTYLPGQKLPSMRVMAEKEGCNPATVNRAFKLLERKGLVCIKSKNGYFITDDSFRIEKLRKEELSMSIKELIKKLKLLGYSGKEICEVFDRYSDFSL